jgi:hypothetical protein
MQTFLPYKDYAESAKVLDMKRLGKQRVETLQVMKALSEESYGWQNHPAVKMWRGHRGALMEYQRAICNEWTSRGYKDTCLEKTQAIVNNIPQEEWQQPAWLGDESIHESHRSNLTRKFPEWYGVLWDEPNDLPYVWPEEVLL